MKNKELATIAWYALKGSAIGTAIAVIAVIASEYVG